MIRILYKRKANIYQTQLTDFIHGMTIETYEMWVSKDRNFVKKNFNWVSMRQYNRRVELEESNEPILIQLELTRFIQWVPKLKGHYLYRFPRVKTTRFEDHAEGIISKKEWDMLHYLDKFKGYINTCFISTILAFSTTYKNDLNQGVFLLRECF